MNNKKTIILLAVVTFCVSLLAQLPAKVVIDTFLSPEQLKQQGIEISGIEGTIWNGKANNIILHNQPLGTVNWQFLPYKIFTGELGVEVAFENSEGYIHSKISVDSGQNITLEDTTGKIAASYIAMRATNFPVTAGGDVLVDLSKVTIIKNKPANIKGRIIWSKASLSMIEFVRLGQIHVQITSDEGEPVTATIRDGGEVLELDSLLTLDQQGSYQLTGHIKARSNSDRALTNSLNMLGRKDANGAVILDYRGKI